MARQPKPPANGQGGGGGNRSWLTRIASGISAVASWITSAVSGAVSKKIVGYLVLAALVIVLAVPVIAGFWWGADRLGMMETHGEIIIDAPKVYTRERLVNDRFEQENWLRKQLKGMDKDFEERIQARTVRRMRRRIMLDVAALGKGVDPAVLQALNNAAAPGDKGESGGGNEPVQGLHVDRFHDHNAFREAIRDELMQTQLDDQHDIAGNTLYRLNFDATLVPGEDTSSLAFILIEAKEDGRDETVETEAKNIARQLAEQLSKQFTEKDAAQLAEQQEEAKKLAGLLDEQLNKLANYRHIYESWHKHLQRLFNRANIDRAKNLFGRLGGDQRKTDMERTELHNFLLAETANLLVKKKWAENDDHARKLIRLYIILARRGHNWFNAMGFKGYLEGNLKAKGYSIANLAFGPPPHPSKPDCSADGGQAGDHACRGQAAGEGAGTRGQYAPTLSPDKKTKIARRLFLRACTFKHRQNGKEKENRPTFRVPVWDQMDGKAADNTYTSKGEKKINKIKTVFMPCLPTADLIDASLEAAIGLRRKISSETANDDLGKEFVFLKIALKHFDTVRTSLANAEGDSKAEGDSGMRRGNTNTLSPPGYMDAKTCRNFVPVYKNFVKANLVRKDNIQTRKMFEPALWGYVCTLAGSITLQMIEETIVDFAIHKFSGQPRLDLPDVPLSCFFKFEKQGCEFGNCRMILHSRWEPKTALDKKTVKDCGEDWIVKTEFMDALTRDTKAFSYGVTPKGIVERISSLLAKQDTARIMLKGGLSSGAAVAGAVINILSESEKSLQGIRRNPLVVGLGDHDLGPGGEDNGTDDKRTKDKRKEKKIEKDRTVRFGWLLGPRYQDGDEAIHIPVQHTLSAVISVPGWWRGLKLNIWRCWINKRKIGAWSIMGVRKRATEICKDEEPKPSEMWVRLPGAVDEISAKLKYSVIERPYIRQSTLLQKPILEVGRPGEVIFEGGRLWRSTVVTLGNQQADRIVVLPHMRGIIAKFDCIKRPAGMTITVTNPHVFAVVWTSEDRTAELRVDLEPFQYSDGEIPCYADDSNFRPGDYSLSSDKKDKETPGMPNYQP
ncbi:MAG: hypothetical protein O6857_06525 [Nitrospinae bacterium]|nr:hypothetical protein [Nitrospinota bacterium]